MPEISFNSAKAANLQSIAKQPANFAGKMSLPERIAGFLLRFLLKKWAQRKWLWHVLC